MKKLILTSTGFGNVRIKEEFLKLIDKELSEIKVLFIPTASRTKEELYYVNWSKKELIEIGVKKENIIVFNLDKEINDFDVIYVCGGNSFYLLHKLRETGFDKKLIDWVNKGKLYIGVSAGSIVAGPDISISSIGDGDKNDVKLKDFTGLNLTNIAISPHFTEKKRKVIKEFKKKVEYKVLPLTDEQALIVMGEKTELIE